MFSLQRTLLGAIFLIIGAVFFKMTLNPTSMLFVNPNALGIMTYPNWLIIACLMASVIYIVVSINKSLHGQTKGILMGIARLFLATNGTTPNNGEVRFSFCIPTMIAGGGCVVRSSSRII